MFLTPRERNILLDALALARESPGWKGRDQQRVANLLRDLEGAPRFRGKIKVKGEIEQ